MSEVFSGVESRRIPGPMLRFRCPVCDSEQTSAASYQYGERLVLFHLIPVSPYTETNYVRCSACRELFVSRVSVFDLPQYAPEELPRLLRRRVPLVPATLAVCGILLVPFPIVGLVMNVISLLLNGRRQRHWTRTVSRIGAVLSIGVTLIFGVLLLLDVMGAL